MPMDFFERQERAQANSRKIVALFLLALPCVIAAVYAVTAAIYFVSWTFLTFWASVFAEAHSLSGDYHYFISLWQPTLLLWVALITLVVIACGSIFKVRQLAPGGRVVASLLGGRRLDPATKDLNETRLLHVVEELSVASGTPLPEIYVLGREFGLNAFVAGHTAGDMVVCVTEGCIRYLTRDELQGVIAHEYSHLLHGDMRLNMRLMGWVHGLFAVTLLSYWVMSKTYRERERDMGDMPESRGGFWVFVDLAILVIGFLLAFIGWNSAFFGRIIKGAVSRQREFLADAAAVQFTRYPEGLVNALRKAKTWAEGTTIHSTRAEEASHIYFCNGLDEERIWLTSTHPPLEERIERVAAMMGMALVPEPAKAAGVEPVVPLPKIPIGEEETELPKPVPVPTQAGVTPRTLLASVGTPTGEHLAYAAKLMEELPESVRSAAREVVGAPALIYSLLLSPEENVRSEQLRYLRENAGAEQFQKVEGLCPLIGALDQRVRIPLVELTFATLRRFSLTEYQSLSQHIRSLVGADREVDLFEFALQKMLRRHLEPVFKDGPRPEVRYYALSGLTYACSTVLSAIAHAGQDAPEQAQAAFARGAKRLTPTTAEFRFMPLADCTLNAIDTSLNNLAEAAPQLKKLFLAACAETTAADGLIKPREAEMLRAIADALECPVPPFLPEAKA